MMFHFCFEVEISKTRAVFIRNASSPVVSFFAFDGLMPFRRQAAPTVEHAADVRHSMIERTHEFNADRLVTSLPKGKAYRAAPCPRKCPCRAVLVRGDIGRKRWNGSWNNGVRGGTFGILACEDGERRSHWIKSPPIYLFQRYLIGNRTQDLRPN
jgi:hypothetical protein